MLCRMICLYQDGVQIDKDKLAETPAHVGNLVIEDWIEGSAFKRPVRYARLLTSDHLIPSDIIPPLFEPDILKMTSKRTAIPS
jgi:hypothetical protein